MAWLKVWNRIKNPSWGRCSSRIWKRIRETSVSTRDGLFASMNQLITIIIILAILSMATKLFPKRKINFVAKDGYRKKESVMNKSEAVFFFELQKQLPQGFYIFPKMRIADLIDATEGYGLRYRKNKILPKHVDYVICNSQFKPVLAIELNGNSHLRQDRIERDNLVNKIFKVSTLPLRTVKLGENFAEISKEISNFTLQK